MNLATATADTPHADANSLLDRYAQLVVRVAANVQVGQDVYVRALVEHAPVARAIAEHCYRAGARRVVVDYADRHVWRSAIEHAAHDTLGELYPYERDRFRLWRERGVVYFSLTGDPDPQIFDGLDASRVSAQARPLVEEINLAEDWTRGQCTSVPAPNEGWARHLFGQPDLERLWAAVAIATRLDEPDPLTAWESHIATLAARAATLQELRLDSVRFRGAGTDLTVGLIPGACWQHASWRTNEGVQFLINLPTEEVYTSPDWRRAEGVVRATAPYMGGMSLRFANGRLVEVDGDHRADVVRADLASDERAPYLGEVALVAGSTSAVRRAGIWFDNGLIDENAACHVAYGTGFFDTIPDGAKLGPDELMAAGVNVSPKVHRDIVIGGPEVEVDGIHLDGRLTPLLRGDAWALPAD